MKKLKPKDLTAAEFWRFHGQLLRTKYGSVLAPMAVVQYFSALRISEAAGLFAEDVKLDESAPAASRLLIRRSVFYPRKKGLRCEVKLGFKNSRKFPDGVKELPIFPSAFEVFRELGVRNRIGLLFSIDGGPVEYRTIQHYYDLAFRRAELPYTATHVMRHGWTREVYNAHPDLEVAKQLLGDTSDEAAKVYAVRRSGQITRVAELAWQSEATGSGRNWSQK